MAVPSESATLLIFGVCTTQSRGQSGICAHDAPVDTWLDAPSIGLHSTLTRMTTGHKQVNTKGVLVYVCTGSETRLLVLLWWPNHPVPCHAGTLDYQDSELAELMGIPDCKTPHLTCMACPSVGGSC